MIRVVLDTNVIVSAALTRGGVEAYALDLAVAHKVELYVSDTTLAEYEGVLRPAKFNHLPAQTIDEMLAKIHNVAIVVQPVEALAISPE